MATVDSEVAKLLCQKLKFCLSAQDIAYASLNDRVARAVNRVIENNTATIGAVSIIAESVFRLVHTPPATADPKLKEKLGRFWKQFLGELRMLLRRDLATISDPEALKQIFLEVVCQPDESPPSLKLNPVNPFTNRSAIRDPAAFFGRENQLRRISDFLGTRSNVQIVGDRRIGKSSLLLEVGRRVGDWLERPQFAWLDMQFPACQTQAGWFRHIAREWQWPDVPVGITDFSERVEDVLKLDGRLVLCLDECEKFIDLADEFPIEFFEGLRACGQKGLSILTASRITLRKIREHGGRLSPYYNIFSILNLGPFTSPETLEFVSRPRPGMKLLFSEPERAKILAFADRHPLKLQIACYHVFEARMSDVGLQQALADARREWEEMRPGEDPPTTP
jgi:hypothetical protein